MFVDISIEKNPLQMTYDIRTQEELARLRIDIKEKMITGRQPQMTLKRVAKRKREEIMGMVRWFFGSFFSIF